LTCSLGGLCALSAELLLTGAALVLLLWDAVRPGARRGPLVATVLVLIAAAWAALRTPDAVAYGVFVVDGTARFLKIVLLVAVLLVTALSAAFKGFADREEPFAWGTYLGLLVISTVGLLFLASASDFLMALIALEIVSVSSFVLVGFTRKDRRSSEAAIKYFLMGAFASGLMVYGISLFYGLTGGTAAAALNADTAARVAALPLTVALLFVLVGFGFKLALAPFHMWVPDVYEGAPTPVTAFLSVAPKAAAFGLLARLFAHAGDARVLPVVALLAAVTMTVGNLGALRQDNVKRLLGYSSIAQMGYVAIAFVAASALGTRAILLYLAAYVFMNLGTFAAVIAVTDDAGREEIGAFDGLAARSLPLALGTTFFLLSLTGIPPFFGFIGKFSIFAAAVQAKGLLWLAVVGVVNSVVSFAYYFSVVRAMFFREPEKAAAPLLPRPLTAVLAVTLAATVLLGLYPAPLLAWVQRIVP
jgi:NADH-quinone oxidoreductase subunit N